LIKPGKKTMLLKRYHSMPGQRVQLKDIDARTWIKKAFATSRKRGIGTVEFDG
jgi:hypothetical protein